MPTEVITDLEALNLKVKELAETASPKAVMDAQVKYLEKESRIKAVTLCFSDIEGRLHMLDYDKKFLLESSDYRVHQIHLEGGDASSDSYCFP